MIDSERVATFLLSDVVEELRNELVRDIGVAHHVADHVDRRRYACDTQSTGLR